MNEAPLNLYSADIDVSDVLSEARIVNGLAFNCTVITLKFSCFSSGNI